MNSTTGSFEPVFRLERIANEPVHADAEEGSEARQPWIVTAERVIFDNLGKKALSQLFCVWNRLVPTKTNVLIDRFPIRLDHHADCLPAMIPVFCSCVQDNRPSCLRELTAGSVFLHEIRP